MTFRENETEKRPVYIDALCDNCGGVLVSTGIHEPAGTLPETLYAYTCPCGTVHLSPKIYPKVVWK